MKTPTPQETANQLREPLNYAEGFPVYVRKILDGLATLIEQNERLIALLEPAVPEKK